MKRIEQLTDTYRETYGHAPAHIARAPGRVNLLGENVDYNDGFVLPAAIDRETYIAFSPTDAHASTLLALDLDQQVSFSPEEILQKRQSDATPLPEWALYPAGVLWALQEENLAAPNMINDSRLIKLPATFTFNISQF